MQTLIKIAATTRPATKTAARAALKAAGLKQTLADDLLTVTAELTAARETAGRARIARRLGYWPINGRRLWTGGTDPRKILWRDPATGAPGYRAGRLPVRLPVGAPADRLADARQRAVLDVYRSTYRAPDAPHGEITVTLTTDPAAVGITQTQHADWGMYAKSYKHPGTVTNTTITVPDQWRGRVLYRGLATVDGMMTLDAAPLPTQPGLYLDAATWLVQGRGYTVTTSRGYIARDLSGASYHADTAQAALDGLARKTRARDLAEKWEQAIATHGLDAIAARVSPAAVVRIADAKAIGACDYGIKSWCHATGLPYDAGQAPLSDVLSAYHREPRSEARAAIIHALRRYRAVDRLSA